MTLALGNHVHLVASGRLGFSLSDDHDCNVFLVSDGDDSVLIDAGCGLAGGEIAGRIAETRQPPVSRILLTHAHADHAAGAGELAGILAAELWASGPVADILEAGDAERAGLTRAIEAGVYPSTISYPPTPVHRRLGAGRIQVGGLNVDVIETPGHARGHLSFVVHTPAGRVLFPGDTVFARGRVVVLATPDTDIAALSSSVDLLVEAGPDSLFAGHGELVLRRATEHIRVAQAAFRLHLLPPPLL